MTLKRVLGIVAFTLCVATILALWRYYGVGELIENKASVMRWGLMNHLQERGLPVQSTFLLSAITLGEKSNLDAETRQAFRRAGASHILAVSGMHLSTIFMILMTLLSFYENDIIRKSILLTFIWLFACLVGLPISIVRAAIMLSIYTLVTGGSRSVNSLRSLFFAGLVIAINPWAVTTIGFQLSFMAMFGIVVLQPYFQKWFPSYLDFLTVTLSATIGTFPLVVYYFHYFPTYFLLTNLVATLALPLIFYCLFFALFFSWCPVIEGAILWALKYVLFGFDWCIRFIESMPYSCITIDW